MRKRILASIGLIGVALSIACAACGSSSTPSSSSSSSSSGGPDSSAAGADSGAGEDGGGTVPTSVTVYSVFELPPTIPTQTLSAIAFEATTKTLYALRDIDARIVPLVSVDDYKTWKAETPIQLTGRPSSGWDGEGLVLANGGFIAVTEETVPTVERFDATGKWLDKVAIPARFASQAQGNKGLESLTISPSGNYLFTANEGALTTDGPLATSSKGQLVRILRLDATKPSNGGDEEHAYRTEPSSPSGGTMGVTDLAALSDDTLLVLERGFKADYGNTVRIFRVEFGSSVRVDAVASLDDMTPVLKKTLVVDLSELPSDGITHPGPQPNPILGNYEGMALGPTIADGRRLLFLITDDNASPIDQVSRVLVLAVRGL